MNDLRRVTAGGVLAAERAMADGGLAQCAGGCFYRVLMTIGMGDVALANGFMPHCVADLTAGQQLEFARKAGNVEVCVRVYGRDSVFNHISTAYTARAERVQLVSLMRPAWVGVKFYGAGVPDSSVVESSMAALALTDDTAAANALLGFLEPNTPAWKEFFSTRKVVAALNSRGEHVYQVVSNIVDTASRTTVVAEPSAVDGARAYVFRLQAVLSDESIRGKYGVTSQLVEAWSGVAERDPDSAAVLAQLHMRRHSGLDTLRVEAAEFSRSRKACVAAVKRFAVQCGVANVGADACVEDGSLFMRGPQSPHPWVVSGPVALASTLVHFYQLAVHMGPAAVNAALSAELTILRCLFEQDGRPMTIVMSYHVGSDGGFSGSSSMASMEMLSTEGRVELERMGSRVMCVKQKGNVIASAVQVTAKHALVNKHVTDRCPDASVGGESLTGLLSVGADLWAARVAGTEAGWLLRDPVVGEKVMVCYNDGVAVCCSSPMLVRVSDGVQLQLTRAPDLSFGMSGGAVVALSDFALLGVYSGVTPKRALAAVFSSEQYTDLCMADQFTVSSHSQADVDVADSAMNRFTKRGLGTVVRAALSSLQPVYSGGRHVATALQAGGKLFTSYDARTYGGGYGVTEDPLSFDEVIPYQLYKADALVLGARPAVVRSPQHNEPVMVVAVDDQGPLVSQRVHVTALAANMRTFTVQCDEAFSNAATGAIVLAINDAAVVGMVVRKVASVSEGTVWQCLPLTKHLQPEQRPALTIVEHGRAVLQKAFPAFQVSGWPDDVVAEVFTHSSVQGYAGFEGKCFNAGNLPLAVLGDAVLKLQLAGMLRQVELPHARWSGASQAMHSNVALAKAAHATGLAAGIAVGNGVSLPPDSKAFADLMEAVVGAAYLHETNEIVESFLLSCGLLLVDYARYK